MLAGGRIQGVSKITLDAETFKALASSTRLTVLKALDERRKTLSELARDLTLNKATVHEHLQLLLAAELVRKRDDEGRKWIYYELTWTGQRILHPEATTSFSVLLGLAGLAGGGGMFLLGRALDWWMSPGEGGAGDDAALKTFDTGQPETASAPADGNGTADSFAQLAPMPEPSTGLPFFDDGGWLALALLATFALFAVLAYFLRRNLRPEPLDEGRAAEAEGAVSNEL